MLRHLVEDTPELVLDFLSPCDVVHVYEAMGKAGVARLRRMMTPYVGRAEAEEALKELRKQRTTCRGVSRAVDALLGVPRAVEVRLAGTRWPNDNVTCRVLEDALEYIEVLIACAEEGMLRGDDPLFGISLEDSPFLSPRYTKWNWMWKPYMLAFPRIHNHVTAHMGARRQLAEAKQEAEVTLRSMTRHRRYI